MTASTVDYLTFSLKPDKAAENCRDIDLNEIIDILGIRGEWGNFEMIGGRNGYPVCYSYNDVLIHESAPERYYDMGYCVMIKGNGLRWLASLSRKFAIHKLLRKLRNLTKTGLSFNVSRLDIALDDKPEHGKGALDLDVITQKAISHEYVSTARKLRRVTEDVSFKGDNLIGRTIYFGSRTSESFVRIYDKAAEQGVPGHWARVEYEFKQATAMRVVNMIIDLGDDFMSVFPEVGNRYLRFIEDDDSNRSRCSTSPFWEEFMGTAKRMKLTINPYKKDTLSRLFKHVMHSWSPSIATLCKAFPKMWILDLITTLGEERMNDRQRNMLKRPDDTSLYFSSSQKWELEIPIALGQMSFA